jgi:hypothetical protein
LSASLSEAERVAAAVFIRTAIFKPWSPGAQGPDAYDCWGLARAVQRRLAGRDLPIINCDPADLRAVVRLVKDHPLHSEWHEVDAPGHLDLVLLSSNRHPHHIGTWLQLDGGGVLHATEQFGGDGAKAPKKPGVTFDGLPALKIQGWAKFKFMRHGATA